MKKNNIDIFIPVRLHSKRLPAKHLRLINGEPALLKLIRRLRRCKKTRKIVVCTTTSFHDDKLVHFLEKESIFYYRGSEHDILSRFLGASKKFKTDVIVDVEGDKIYTDPAYVDKIIEELTDPKIDFVIGNDSKEKFNPNNHLIHGFIPAGMKKSALQKLCDIKITENTETGYREFFTKSEIFNCKYIIPDNFKDNPEDFRLTLDYEEDLKLANKIFGELGNNFSSDDVLELFKQKPSLNEITKPIIEKWNKHYQDNITKYELK